MAAHLPNIRQRKGYIRLFQLISSFVGLILVITALTFHGTESFIGYEASFSTVFSLTSVSFHLCF